MKKPTALLFACMMIGTFTACGKNNDDDNGGRDNTTEPTTAAATEAAEGSTGNSGRIDGDTLTLSSNGREMVLTRSNS